MLRFFLLQSLIGEKFHKNNSLLSSCFIDFLSNYYSLHLRLIPKFIRLCRCCRKGDPFQGLKLDSCLTLRNELSKETHVLTKQEILLGKGTQVESRRVREPRRTALPCGCSKSLFSSSLEIWTIFYWPQSFPTPGRVLLI